MTTPAGTTQAATTLAGRTLLMSGGSRGIGLAIATRAAQDGANVVLLAKTAEPHPLWGARSRCMVADQG